MSRPATHRVREPHNLARFKDKIEMLNYRRGPSDDIWAAVFAVIHDGNKPRWEPRDGISTGERDFAEACFKAHEMYVKRCEGLRVARHYKRVKNSQLVLHKWAARAVKRLKRLQIEAENQPSGQNSGDTFKAKWTRIEKHFAKTDRETGKVTGRWAFHQLDELTTEGFVPWVRDELTVQGKDGARKKAAMQTIKNIDGAFAEIWYEAAKATKLLTEDPKLRPKVPKRFGREDLGLPGEIGAYITLEAVKDCAAYMSDAWCDSTDDKYGPDLKRMFRCYFATLATTGLTPGREACRQLIRYVKFQPDGTTINFWVRPKQGKTRGKPGTPVGRNVSAFIGDDVFDMWSLLKAHIKFRKSQGADDNSDLFALTDGSFPDESFAGLYKHVLGATGHTTDAEGKDRTPYSLRHFYATRMIVTGKVKSAEQLAPLMGNSAKEIWGVYAHVFDEYNASDYTGAELLNRKAA